MSLTIKNLCKFAMLGICFTFAGYSSSAAGESFVPDYGLISKVRNSVLEKYSTSYTIDEALSKLKCEKQSWVPLPNNSFNFNCISTEDTESLNKFNKGINRVVYAVTFYTTNGQISDIGANIWIHLPDGAKVGLRDAKGLKLGRDELFAAALNPAEKGRIFPLSNFIKFRSGGRYTDLIDFVEKNNPIRIVQNGFLKEFSTTTTVGETMNRLKCDNQKWQYSQSKKTGKRVKFSCEVRYLDKSHKETVVDLSAIFGMLDDGFEAKSCGVSLLRAGANSEPEIYTSLKKVLELNANDLWPTIFSTAEKGYPLSLSLNDFIKFHSNGRYSDISDLLEKEKSTHNNLLLNKNGS